jgi:hypothetical protein
VATGRLLPHQTVTLCAVTSIIQMVPALDFAMTKQESSMTFSFSTDRNATPALGDIPPN